MATLMLSVCMRTDLGSARTVNEDSVMWDPDLALLAVADGMGGHNAGEVASRVALDTIRTFLRESVESEDCTWPFGIDAKISFTANRLMTAVKMANRRVHRVSEQRAECFGMGTTVVAAVAEGSRLTLASVGDSRLYVITAGGLEQLTTDDSWVSLLAKESGLAPSAFESHPMRNMLTSVVGARAELKVTVKEIDLVDGQTIILSTDGLHRALTDAAMLAIVNAETDIERATTALVETAIKKDSGDDVTILVARYTANA